MLYTYIPCVFSPYITPKIFTRDIDSSFVFQLQDFRGWKWVSWSEARRCKNWMRRGLAGRGISLACSLRWERDRALYRYVYTYRKIREEIVILFRGYVGQRPISSVFFLGYYFTNNIGYQITRNHSPDARFTSRRNNILKSSAGGGKHKIRSYSLRGRFVRFLRGTLGLWYTYILRYIL